MICFFPTVRVRQTNNQVWRDFLDNTRLEKQNKNYYNLYPRIVALSFIVLILAGTVLLMLPISVKQGEVGFADALFTATSASCVTGLVVFDTFSKWTLFGQIVILCLIQIGGLGFITIMTMLTRFLKKRVSLKEKLWLKESFGTAYSGDTRRLVKRVITGTVIIELLGAIILSTQLIPVMNFKDGLFTAVFLSVSAFCNAGFDVLGRIEAGSSLITVNNNPVILITICALIIIGGIGFIVWDDLIECKARFNRYSLHTKLTLTSTVILLVLGTVLFFIFEKSNCFADMPLWQKIYNSFFASVTPRTAGFNSVPNNMLTSQSRLIMCILMFIGGSSGSTAGGVKVSTFAVLLLCVGATFKRSKDIEVFGKRLTSDILRKAMAIITINAGCIIASSLIISFIQPQISFSDILFECTSAIGTVGMSTGITSGLSLIPEIIITAMMFIGRITSLIFVFMFFFENKGKTTQKPKGDMLIG